MAEPQNPVIVVPGITGTSLHDAYPPRSEELWSPLLDREFERLALHLGGRLPRFEIDDRQIVKHLRPRFAGPVWGTPVPGVRRWTPPIAGLRQRAS